MTAHDIRRHKEQALARIACAPDGPALEALRIEYVGRKGLLPRIMRELGTLPESERANAGREANAFKKAIQEALERRRSELASVMCASCAEPLDVTVPGQWRGVGAWHPINLIIRDVVQICARMGFRVADGPDVETKYNNFEALNTPDHHPSLDARDTFWLATGQCLRTHTSPVQIRVMSRTPPPVRVVIPGRCYRRDTTDATHSANFHQIEGLYVDRNVSMAELKGTLAYLARELMGPSVRIRFRPHFFPFTEPSVECDFSCHVCGGSGCRVCKQSGWIEIAGAGMVDPRVFQQVGYDAERYTGFAWGMGVERLAMIKFGLTDIRILYENDLRFLDAFR